MATSINSKPLVVIVGPTASGKTGLAIRLAQRYDGEVICADSRTVFQEMNIGTAKPTVQEMQGIPHWGLDLTAPGQRYTAAQFKAYATEKIADIRGRGKLPIMAGGTGLYVDGVIFDYDYPRPATPTDRSFFEQMSLDEIYKYCQENNIELPINDKNKRHLIAAALRKGERPKRREQIIDNTIVVGIATQAQQLRHAIMTRSEHMFADGVVEEASQLGKKYGWQSKSIASNVYPLIRDVLEDHATQAEAQQAFQTRDWQLAKRQMTWFRRNPFIEWCTLESAEAWLADRLAPEHNL